MAAYRIISAIYCTRVACKLQHMSLGRRAEYCDDHICLFACLSVREHISGTTRPIFTKFCACYLRPWQQRCGLSLSVVHQLVVMLNQWSCTVVACVVLRVRPWSDAATARRSSLAWRASWAHQVSLTDSASWCLDARTALLRSILRQVHWAPVTWNLMDLIVDQWVMSQWSQVTHNPRDPDLLTHWPGDPVLPHPHFETASRQHLRSAASHQLSSARSTGHIRWSGVRCRGPSTWNSLPKRLRDLLNSTSVFGRLIKHFSSQSSNVCSA